MKNKFLTISILFILISFTFINSCFAYSNNDSINVLFNACVSYLKENNIEYYDYVILRGSNLNSFMFYFMTSENYTFYIGKYNGINYIHNNNSYMFYFDLTDSELVPYFEPSTTVYPTLSVENNDIIYSSFDVKNQNGTLFFHQTPVPTTLAGVLEKMTKQATLEVGQIILIVIMTTAGLMVLLVGLKKGLTVLMNGFRH